MCDIQPAHVGYKLIAVKVGLLSHDYRIYMASLQQKQAVLCLYNFFIRLCFVYDR